MSLVEATIFEYAFKFGMQMETLTEQNTEARLVLAVLLSSLLLRFCFISR